MLNSMEEGKVYEVLLVTTSNVTPIGVVREDNVLRFKLFPGRSFRDLLMKPRASIQITNDVELIVKAALNLPIDVKFEGGGGFRWIAGLPGCYGDVEYELAVWKDEIGESEVLLGRFVPSGRIGGSLRQLPLSRADFMLLEMAVHFTRFTVSRDPELSKKIKLLYGEYRKLGGHSEVAEYIMKNSENPRIDGQRENF